MEKKGNPRKCRWWGGWGEGGGEGGGGGGGGGVEPPRTPPRISRTAKPSCKIVTWFKYGEGKHQICHVMKLSIHTCCISPTTTLSPYSPLFPPISIWLEMLLHYPVKGQWGESLGPIKNYHLQVWVSQTNQLQNKLAWFHQTMKVDEAGYFHVWQPCIASRSNRKAIQSKDFFHVKYIIGASYSVALHFHFRGNSSVPHIMFFLRHALSIFFKSAFWSL